MVKTLILDESKEIRLDQITTKHIIHAIEKGNVKAIIVWFDNAWNCIYPSDTIYEWLQVSEAINDVDGNCEFVVINA